MDDFKINQLTKELVSARLRELGDPCAVAAQLVHGALQVALKGLPPGSAAESRVIEDACQGAMTSLLLNDQSLVRGAVLILERVVDLAAALNLDGPEMMRSALRGISDMRRFARPEQMAEIRYGIEARFQGAGLAFEALCAEPVAESAPLPPKTTP